MGKNLTSFQPGHLFGVGNPGPGKAGSGMLVQALISQLNEVDRHTKKSKVHRLVAQLINLATGYERIVRTMKNGKRTSYKVDVPPSIDAIKEIFDRIEGKAVQPIANALGDGFEFVLTIGRANGENAQGGKIPGAEAKLIEHTTAAASVAPEEDTVQATMVIPKAVSGDL